MGTTEKPDFETARKLLDQNLRKAKSETQRVYSKLEEYALDYLRRKRGKFKDDGDLLEAAAIMFQLPDEMGEHDADQASQLQLQKAMRRWFRKALRAHPKDSYISGIFRQYKLCRLEQDILLLLAAEGMGMGISASDIDDVQKYLDRKKGDRLTVMRAFAPEGRLVSSGLVNLDGRSERLAHCNVTVAPAFLMPLLKKAGSFCDAWEVVTQEDLLKKLYLLTTCYEDRAGQLDNSGRSSWWEDSDDDIEKVNGQVKRLEETLERTMKIHPKWRVCQLLREKMKLQERRILIILLAKELRYLEGWYEAGSGNELAKAISETVPEIRESLGMLRSNATLRKRNQVRICALSAAEKIDDDPETLRKCEFELTPKTLKQLKIKRQVEEKSHSRKPVVTMKKLILHDNVKDALAAAVMQSRHHRTLFKKWGLGETIPYGRSVTLLFGGPPGVGKTACAEALANELGKTILVADYSQIQNCLVGQTEKNISATFRAAREENAVLFWDEADAMFYDRDSADRNWEVRDVNVLLQEIERFDGVCILATNRKITLDKALERRISMKIDFQPPTQIMSKAIWRKLIPKKMPLDKEIDFTELGAAKLTGGQIKNAVLNATRKAIRRGKKTRIRMDDFRWAIALEKDGALNPENTRRIGFHGGCKDA